MLWATISSHNDLSHVTLFAKTCYLTGFKGYCALQSDKKINSIPVKLTELWTVKVRVAQMVTF